jgi:Flp pilus assembly CpaE family ATPase
VLIVDVPWTGDEHFLQTLSRANHVVLVAEQNLPSLRSLRLVLDMLKRSNLTTVAGSLPVELVVNRYDTRSRDFPVERVKEVLETPELTTIANDYPSVNASVNRGVPLRVGAPRSKALTDIVGLTTKLFGAAEARADAKNNWNLFDRLANVFSSRAAT